MAQNTQAPGVWSKAIQDLKPERIIEIGTGSGGWTSLLALLARNIGCHSVLTMDKESNSLLIQEPDVEYRIGDCFSDISGFEYKIASHGLSLLLCDGGNKIKEFNTFAKYLKSGDVIAAHDYIASDDYLSYWQWSEITQKDVEETVKEVGLVPFMQSDMNRAAWLAFKKV